MTVAASRGGFAELIDSNLTRGLTPATGLPGTGTGGTRTERVGA